jgi:hypothetical protein
MSELVFEEESLSELLSDLVTAKRTRLSELRSLRIQIPGGVELQLKRPRTELEPETELDFEANDD